MCELNVYLEGEEVARGVVRLVVSGDKILMEDILPRVLRCLLVLEMRIFGY